MPRPYRQLQDLAPLLKRLDPQSVMVFRGKQSYKNSQYRDVFESCLKHYSVHYFSDYRANPTVEDIEHARHALQQCQPDLVIAIGGGSVMDTAKLARFFDAQSFSPTETPSITIVSPRSQLWCIPTTSGTGSESTQFATYYIGHTKHSLDHDSCLPNTKILDVLCVQNLPKELALTTGLDSLCHALESLWAKRATKASQTKALIALGSILQNLVPRIEQPNTSNCLAMLEAASLAGEAIQISRTTAAHAISYPLTSIYNIPHGLAAAMTIRQLLAFNTPALNSSLQKQVCQALALNNFSQLDDQLANLFTRLKVKTSLQQFGIDPTEAKENILPHVSQQRLANNPRPLTVNNIVALLENSPNKKPIAEGLYS
ncbi:MAG: phosphonoacetaldehyde reductase [Agarilytica sp.]